MLIIGSDYEWSIERIYRRELIKLGHHVLFIPVQNWFYDFYYHNLLNRVLYNTGLSRILININKRILSETDGEYFDLIWVFKGMEIFPTTLGKIKKKTSRLINFNPDNPFVFSGRGSGNSNVRNGIPFYDHYFTYDHQVRNKIEIELSVKCSLVPFGFDQNVIPEDELLSIEEIKAVCFVGNPDNFRAKLLKVVLNAGFQVHVYGNNWSNYISHPLILIHQPVYGKDFYKTLRGYRVQLNIMRPHNPDSHNMRSMEVPGCGGIMLAPKTTDHLNFFDDGQHAFLYNDNQSLIQNIQFILNLESSTANIIRIAARKLVMSKYTYSRLIHRFI